MLDAGIYEQLSRLVIAMKQKSSQNLSLIHISEPTRPY